jgi:integrase
VRCTATTRAGKRCRNRATNGGRACWVHAAAVTPATHIARTHARAGGGEGPRDRGGLAAGVLGHANISTTLDKYGHLMPGAEDEAAALLDAYLDAASASASARGRPPSLR